MVDTFELAIRLLRGEVVEIEDDAGRLWRATSTSLAWVFRGEPCAVLENVDAFEVSNALVARIVDACVH